MSNDAPTRKSAPIHEIVRHYLSICGRKGGAKSRRVLTPDQARAMVAAREAKRELRKKEIKK